MIRRNSPVRQLTAWLVIAGTMSLLWLSWPTVTSSAEANPVAQAQAQPQPSPTVRTTPTPRPTPSLDERRTELELRKLDREGDVLGAQDQLLQLQREEARQIWRAPAEFVALVGPTLVGIGLLLLAARALAHFLPAPPPKPEQPRREEDVEEDEEL